MVEQGDLDLSRREAIAKENQGYIDRFETWLAEKGVKAATSKEHQRNAIRYLDYSADYSSPLSMAEHCSVDVLEEYLDPKVAR